MPSATQTLTATLDALSLRGSNGTSPFKGDLKVQPLEFSGALNAKDYPREELTPALGDRFDAGVKLKEILALPKEQGDALLRDLAILSEWDALTEDAMHKLTSGLGSFAVSHRGVVFFQDQRELVPEDLGNLALRLGELAGKPSDSSLHIHPTQELSENGLPLGKISSTPDKEGRQISFPEKGLTSAGWHTDVSFEPRPSLFTILQMVSDRFPSRFP